MIKTTLKNCSEYIKTQHMRRYFVNRDSWMVDECNLPRLSKQEIEDANKMWPFCKVNERDLIWLRMYKKEYGFDPSFVTDYQLLLIFRKTNPYKQVVSLEHKAMFDIYYPEIPTPHNYIKVINGTCWYEGEVCSWDTALSQLSKTSVENVVVKPTTDTGCGKGVQITKVESLNGEVLGNNFVIQELLKQHSDIARFNPTSINSCRVTSIFLEGVFSFSCTFKTGKQGSRIDNWNSSYFVGVNSDGTLHDYGFDSKLNPFKQTDTGIVFGGNTLPKYDVMIERISFWHQHYFPQVGIIGWDVFIDDNEQIKVIEVNLSSPGIVGEQFCSGAFFGKRRDAILKLFQ